MIAFLRNFCASLAALIVFFIAVPFTFLVIIAAVIASIGEKDKLEVSKGGVLVLDLSDGVSETSPASNFKIRGKFFKTPPESTFDICAKIRAAAADPSVNALLIKGSAADSPSGISLAQASEIREAVEKFSEKGKVSYAYLENPCFADYYLASAARAVIMNPFGSMEYKGLALQSVYLGGAMKKYGIGVALVKSGEFKSAGEMFTSDKMPESQKAHLSKVLQSLWSGCQSQISVSRGIPEAPLSKIAREEAIFSAYDAKKFGFVDELMYADALIEMLKTTYGEKGNTFKNLSIRDYSVPINYNTAKIAVVALEGEICEDSVSSGRMSAKKIAGILRRIRADNSVKAVVLRIDSPGGSAYASEVIRREVEALSQKAKVVASFGSTAASGAYWISTAAHKICADASTITGSIGVFSVGFDIEKIAAEHGVKFDGVKTDPMADFMSALRAADDRDLAKMKDLCDDVYERFVMLVCKSRKMDIKDVEKIADGKIYTGAQALEIGLCDSIGGVESAINEAAKLAKIGSYKVVQYPKYDPISEIFPVDSSSAEILGKAPSVFGAKFGKCAAFVEETAKLSRAPLKRRVYMRIFPTFELSGVSGK